MHVAMLGDSVFDNISYIQPGEPDVRTQLDKHLAGAVVTLLAVDGNTIGDISDQLNRMPSDTTHIVLSIGGNDLLGQADLLLREVTMISEALFDIAEVLAQFEANYRDMVQMIVAQKVPVVICTVYNPNQPDKLESTIMGAAVSFFDDAIIRVATEVGLPVVDLRSVCTTKTDFANPIEPSAIGGDKIATVLADVLQTHDFSMGQTTIYTLRKD